MSILARLGVVMTVDSAEFRKGIDEATLKSRAFQAELKRQNQQSAQFGKDVAAALNKVAAVAAVAGAAIYKAFSYADQIKDTASALDVTIQSLVSMRLAFREAGGEMDNMGNLLSKLVINQDKAREGADNVREAFSRLGIAGGEVENLAPDELFNRVAQALSQIEDPARRNALAFEILGKAAKGIDWKEYWRAYGAGEQTSKDVASAIQAASDAWGNLEKVGTKALNAILILAKPLADLINKFAAAANDPRRDNYSERFNQAKKELESDPVYLAAGLKKRREMIDARAQELAIVKETAKVENNKPENKATKGGYSTPSNKEQASAQAREALREAFKLRVEQLSTIGRQISRETELIGLNEQEAERRKLRWAIEDENLRMQLDFERQIALEKAKGRDADQERIRLLEDQRVAYAALNDMAKAQAETELQYKEAKIRSQQILTNTEREGMNQLVDNFQILGQQSKAAFAAWKAFSIVNTIIDTYSGAQKAFTSLAGIPVIGPALGTAAAAVAIAAGLARVNMIRNQQYQGRQYGGSIVANTPYMVGEAGPELVIPNRSGTVIPNNQLSSVMGGGGVTYNGPYIANLSAIDTKSFEDMIYNSNKAVWAANQYATKNLPTSRMRT